MFYYSFYPYRHLLKKIKWDISCTPTLDGAIELHGIPAIALAIEKKNVFPLSSIGLNGRNVGMHINVFSQRFGTAIYFASASNTGDASTNSFSITKTISLIVASKR